MAFHDRRNPFVWFAVILVFPFALGLVLLMPRLENVMADAHDVEKADGEALHIYTADDCRRCVHYVPPDGKRGAICEIDNSFIKDEALAPCGGRFFAGKEEG